MRDIDTALRFQQQVLGAQVVYADPDFAVLTAHGAEWMLHADHAYQNHPLGKLTGTVHQRGAGVELRLHGCAPDAAAAAAREHGYTVLAEIRVAGHGLREVHLLHPDGYVWVPDVIIEQPGVTNQAAVTTGDSNLD